jgi:hypothetical protein
VQLEEETMFQKIASNPLLALCFGLSACAADGVARAQSHEHGATGDRGELRQCKSTDDIVDAIATALEVSRKYQDVAVAKAEGYRPESPCESSAEGTMGIHYVHEGKIAAPPDVLKLVAIEYFQPVIQDGEPYLGSESEPPRPDSLPAEPPELFDGQPFDGPMAGHNPTMPWHYDQHVWLYAHNPDGLFAPWNPAIACPDQPEAGGP